tara:strand:- start:342 stop:578 length:237 start_codon:yes stop_codon:yes gene_type:complete
MSEKYLQVEGHNDLVRDTQTGAVINRNRGAFEKAKQRSREVQKRNDELRDATREINNLKCEMHEIKSLLKELVNKDGN